MSPAHVVFGYGILTSKCALEVNYAADLAKVMKKTILLSKVAYLAKEIEKEYVIDGDGKSHRKSKLTSLGVSHEKLAFLLSDALSDERESDGNESYTRGVATSNDDSPYVIDPSYKDKYTGALTDAQRARVTTLLGEWEEPENKLGVEVCIMENVQLILSLKIDHLTPQALYLSGKCVCQCDYQVSTVTRIHRLAFHVLVRIWLGGDTRKLY